MLSGIHHGQGLRSIVAYLLVLSLYAPLSFAQGNLVEGSVGMPVPESNVTFSRFFDGQFHVGVAYSRILGRGYRAGVGFEYSRFHGGLRDDLDMHVLMPAAHVAYMIDFSGDLDLEGSLKAGFAWIHYRSESPIEVDIFDESGPYVSPGIHMVFTSSPVVQAKMGVGYNVIFEHFGDEATEDDSTIRYLLFRAGLIVRI